MTLSPCPKIEVDADDIAIGEIIGSGSSAEVRKGRVRGKVPGVFEYVSDSQTGATIDRRTRERGIANPSDPGAPASVGRGAMAGMPQIAVKVLRDAKRQTLKRFWSEVLIMKVKYRAARSPLPIMIEVPVCAT